MLTRSQADLRHELSASENQRRLADAAAAEAKSRLDLVEARASQVGEEARSALHSSGKAAYLCMRRFRV